MVALSNYWLLLDGVFVDVGPKATSFSGFLDALKYPGILALRGFHGIKMN